MGVSINPNDLERDHKVWKIAKLREGEGGEERKLAEKRRNTASGCRLQRDFGGGTLSAPRKETRTIMLSDKGRNEIFLEMRKIRGRKGPNTAVKPGRKSSRSPPENGPLCLIGGNPGGKKKSGGAKYSQHSRPRPNVHKFAIMERTFPEKSRAQDS